MWRFADPRIKNMRARRIAGGGLLLVAGVFLGKETFSHLFGLVLDGLTAGMAQTVTWETFPWGNAAGMVIFLLGVGVLLWPNLKRLFRRIVLDEERVTELVSSQLAGKIDAAYLAERLAEFDVLRAQLAADVAGLHERVAKISDVIRARELVEIMGPMKREADQRLDEPPPTKNANQHETDAAMVQRLFQGLQAFDLPDFGVFEATRTKAVADVRADNLMSTLEDDDGQRWENGSDKRDWHVGRAELRAFSDYLGGYLDRCGRKRILKVK